MDLTKHFEPFRKNTIGNNHPYQSPYGEQKVVYADWIASGRLYGPVEDKMRNLFGPFVANTHTETAETGTLMTNSYKAAQCIIKHHVNANDNDVFINAGFGMTAAVNKLQRILGMRSCGRIFGTPCLSEREKPVVFVTHMEHHSNHTSWYATNAEVVVLPPGKDMLVDLNVLEKYLKKYKKHSFKIGSFTACSNVTGISTPYHEMASLMHRYGGLCFVDFAASAPYMNMDMHPAKSDEKLDAVFFSPHKFLGGPGAGGVLIFDKSMYHCTVPDQPGGGTVDWTNPWGEYKFVDDIESREDGGTPGFLQTIRTALAIRLKEKMDVNHMAAREKQITHRFFSGIQKIKGIQLLAEDVSERLPVFSFYHEKIHYNLFVKLLSDRYGIQCRGGCACAGTYGHFLLEVNYEKSKEITNLINHGDLSQKPGWVRVSMHPTMTDMEVDYILHAIGEIVKNYKSWQNDYQYDIRHNEFYHKTFRTNYKSILPQWFTFED